MAPNGAHRAELLSPAQEGACRSRAGRRLSPWELLCAACADVGARVAGVGPERRIPQIWDKRGARAMQAAAPASGCGGGVAGGSHAVPTRCQRASDHPFCRPPAQAHAHTQALCPSRCRTPWRMNASLFAARASRKVRCRAARCPSHCSCFRFRRRSKAALSQPHGCRWRVPARPSSSSWPARQPSMPQTDVALHQASQLRGGALSMCPARLCTVVSPGC